jgi:hypothetical protein
MKKPIVYGINVMKVKGLVRMNIGRWPVPIVL